MALDKERVRKAAGSQLGQFTESVQKTDSTADKKKLTKRDTHKVYSFWAEKTEIEQWKCYQEANPDLRKAEDLGLNAIREYIANHPLTGNDQERYEENLRRAKEQGLL